jgi:hypothetical protein
MDLTLFILTPFVLFPLISFIFVCLIFPKIVRNRPQFYIALALIVLTLLLNILAQIVFGTAFARFLLIFNQILLLFTFILLVLCAGGLSLHELSGEVFRSFEVMRRGETEKTVIVPLTGQKPKVRDEEDDQPVRQSIDTPTPPPPDSNSSIPLEEPKE